MHNTSFLKAAKELVMKAFKTMVVTAILSLSAGSFAATPEDHIRAGNYERAYEELTTAAKKGDLTAYARAGDLVINGVVPSMKPSDGITLFRLGADKGDPESMMRLAFFHKTGYLGVEENSHKEHKYLEKAAKAGSAIAYSALGWLQLTSKDPRVSNDARGIENLYSAIEKGSPYGYVRLGGAYWLGHGGLERNQILGLALYQYAKENGVTGSEEIIESKVINVLAVDSASKEIADIKKAIKTHGVKVAIDRHIKKNGAFFDYRHPPARDRKSFEEAERAGRINSPKLSLLR